MKTEIINGNKYRCVYAVGDIHGEISMFHEELFNIGFDKKTDLLVSVGDLIDRGEDSVACLKLINQPWFKCVMGNHEKMAFDAVTEKTEEKLTHWAVNGGNWFLELDDKSQAEMLINEAGKLPLVIELNLDDKKVIFCHADYPLKTYDRKAKGIEEHLIWSRERISELKQGLGSEIKGADLFIFGHTPLKSKLKAFNQLYIDTAACFGNKLTIIDVNSEIE